MSARDAARALQRLPGLMHARLPAWRRTSGGVDVPCDGPLMLALDDNGEPICADCETPVVKTS